MKRSKLAAVAACISVLAIASIDAKAGDLNRIRCTCYVEDGWTYSGHYTNDHVIAGMKSNIGDVAALYAIDENGDVGEFIGYFDFYDIGAGIDTDGDGKGDSIIKGKSIDVFRNNMTEAKEWIRTYGDYVFIKIIKAEG